MEELINAIKLIDKYNKMDFVLFIAELKQMGMEIDFSDISEAKWFGIKNIDFFKSQYKKLDWYKDSGYGKFLGRFITTH